MHQSGPPLTGSAGESSAAGPRRRRPATGLINLPQARSADSLLCYAQLHQGEGTGSWGSVLPCLVRRAGEVLHL